jgi:hypothetical protein
MEKTNEQCDHRHILYPPRHASGRSDPGANMVSSNCCEVARRTKADGYFNDSPSPEPGRPMKIRSDVGSLLAAGLAHEARFQIRET